MLPYPGMAPGMMPPGAVPLPVERPPHEERPGSPRQRDYHEEQPRERARRRGKWDEASPDGAAPLPSTAAPLLPASAYTMPPQPGLLMAAAPQMLPQAHLAAGAPPAGYVFNAALMTHALAPQPQPQPRALQQANKKQREIYVGNLLQHVVSAQMIKDFFTQILQSLPSFDPSAGLPVVNVQMSGEGKFAFVELRDETLATTMLKLDKVELCGRPLNVGRPSNFVPSPVLAMPLDTSHLRLPGLNAQQAQAQAQQQLLQMPQGYGAAAAYGGAAPPPKPAAPPQSTRKQRELYVGNLAMGLVTAQMLRDLFTLPLQSMPGFDLAKGPAVVNVDLSGEGKFAFVELRDETLAATAISLFHDMELCGRKLHIGRPRGYVDPAGALPPGGQQYNALLGAAAAYRPPVAPAPQLYAPQPQQAYAPPMPAVGGYAMPPPQPTHYDPAAAGTPFLCLENLVSAEALRDEREYAEIVQDIHSECQKAGQVYEIRVPRPGRPEAAPYVGRAFVRFADVGAARAACAVLNGRQFDGNIVRATFVTAQAYGMVPP